MIMRMSIWSRVRRATRAVVLCLPVICEAQEPAPLPPDRLLSEVARTAPRTGEEKALALELKLDAFRQLAASSDLERRRTALALAPSLVVEVRQVHGKNSSLLIELLRDVARLHAATGEMGKALASLERAVEVSNAVLGPKDPAGRFLLFDLADAQAAAAKTLAAAQTRRRAEKLEQIAIASVLGGTLGAAPEQNAPYSIVPVHFKTTRSTAGKLDPYRHFQSVRASEDTFGISYVSVPRDRAVGPLPQPSVFRLDFRPDPARHVIVKEIVKSNNHSAFLASLRDGLQTSQRKEVLIYIHGFNQSFANAVETAAGMAVDLEVDGSVLAFSWPSKNDVLRYAADIEEVSALRNQQALRDLITEAATAIGAQRVFLVAHSLGNRLLLQTLNQMLPAAQPYFDSIVFASPDVEGSDFAARVKAAAPLAKSMTLYAVDNDIPLWLSATLKEGLFGKDDYVRAGNTRAKLPSTDFLDVIDATRANVSWLGHDSFAYLAKDDMRALLWFDLRAAQRCVLDRNGLLWRYAPNSPCTSEAFQVASVFRRRYHDVPAALANLANQKGDVYPLARDILQKWPDASR